jgi:muramidase (phage lysozyme)
VLAYFPGPPGNAGGAAGRYRIQSEEKVEVEPALERHVPAPAYQNREIYALFSRFEVIRLSHLKSGTREVLVAKSRRPVRD